MPLACTDTDDVLITVNTLPTANAGSDVTICTGSSTNLSASGGSSYSWSPSSGLSSTNVFNPTVDPINTTTYTVTVTDANNCTDTDDVVVTVSTSLTTDAGTDVAICTGASTNLQASGGSNYSWSPSIGLSSTNVSNPVASPTTTTTYTVTATDSSGCTGIDQVIVSVNSLPSADAGVDVTICTGSSTTLSASGGSSYSWSPTTDLSATDISNPTANPTSTTTYAVTVTDANGCTDTDEVVITVNSLPTASAGGDVTICTGSTASLSASGGTSYSWSPSTGLNSTTISNPTTSPTATTTYTVTISDANGCKDSDEVVIIVNALPTANAGGDVSICTGSSTNLSASGGTSYLWSPSIGISSTVVANPIASPTTTTTYTVTVTDANGCTDTDQVEVTVNALPFANAGSDLTICTGSSTGLNASGGTSYSWSPSTGLSATNVSNPTANPTTTTTYTITVTDANGCTDTDDIMVTVNSLPTANAGSDITICAGSSTALSASGGMNYAWSPSAGLSATNVSNPTANPTISTTYVVTVTDANGCTDTDDVVVTINALPADPANPTGASFCDGASIPSLSISDPGSGFMITWWGTASGGNQVSGATLTGSRNEQITLSNSSSPAAPVTGTSVTIYTEVENTATGCKSVNREPVTLTNNDNPTIISISPMVCTGETTMLIASIFDGTTPYNYLWTAIDSGITPFGGSNVNASASPTFDATGISVGDYDVELVVTDANGCADKDTVIVAIQPGPDSTFVALGDMVCAGDENIIYSVAEQAPGTNYTWLVTNGTVVSGGASTDTSVVVDWDQGGTFGTVMLTILLASGCQAMNVVNVTISPVPDLTLSANGPLCLGDTLNLTAGVSGGTGGFNYSWTGPNSFTSSQQNPMLSSITEVNQGTYRVTVTDANGCFDIDSIDFQIECFDLALQKVESSNGPNSRGSTVSYNIIVYNQGFIEATNVGVKDFIPTGMTLAAGSDSIMNISSLAPGADTTLTISLVIDSSFQDTSLVNSAEIISATNALGLTDQDSNPNNNSNSTPELSTDNDINDEAAGTPGTMDNSLDEDDFDPAHISVQQQFDLALSKVESSTGPYIQGSIVTYDITVSNEGSVDAANIIVTDYIPSGMVLATGNVHFSTSGNDAVASIDSLAVGAQTTVAISLQIDASFMSTSLTNIAEITNDGNAQDLPDEDSTPNNGQTAEDDQDSATINVEQNFDLALVKKLNASTPGPFVPGSSVLYDVTVYNQGSLDAINIQITDYIPSGMVLNDTTWSGNGTGGPSTTTRSLTGLSAGDSATITILFTVDSTYMGTTITNNAEVTRATNGLGLIDEDSDLATINGSSGDTSELSTNDEYSDEYASAPGLSDNASDVDDYDPAQITVDQEFDLAITKKLNASTPGPFDPGSTVTFDVTIYNQGTINAVNIGLTDYIPTGLTLNDENWSGNGSSGPNTTTLTIDSLSARDSTTLSITFDISTSFMGATIVNNVEITAATNALSFTDEDGDLAIVNGSANDHSELSTDNEYSDEYGNAPGTADNASDSDDYDPVQITVNQEFDLALTKKLNGATPSPFVAGSPVIFDVTVYNQGTLNATNVQLTDYIPTGLTLNDSSWSGNGTSGPATTILTIDSLSAGDSTTATVTFYVDSSFMGTTITNNTEITAATNALGLVDEDGALGTVDGSANDTSELATDDEYSDEYINAPGTSDHGLDVDDYDLAQITIDQDFDLALNKKINTSTPGPFVTGSAVIYDITIYNQGTLDATNVQLTDYIPTGLTLNDVNWSGNGKSGPDTTTYSIANLSAGDSVTVTIAFNVSNEFMGTIITNNEAPPKSGKLH